MQRLSSTQNLNSKISTRYHKFMKRNKLRYFKHKHTGSQAWVQSLTSGRLWETNFLHAEPVEVVQSQKSTHTFKQSQIQQATQPASCSCRQLQHNLASQQAATDQMFIVHSQLTQPQPQESIHYSTQEMLSRHPDWEPLEGSKECVYFTLMYAPHPSLETHYFYILYSYTFLFSLLLLSSINYYNNCSQAGIDNRNDEHGSPKIKMVDTSKSDSR